MTVAGLTVDRHESAEGFWEMTRRPAHPSLAAYVRHYVGWRERTRLPLRRREVPMAGIHMIISFGPATHLLDPADPSAPARRHVSFVPGLHDALSLIETDGEGYGLEAELTPLGARRILGIPMHELSNRVSDLEDLLGGRAAALLTERLYEAAGWPERFDLLEAVFAGRVAEGPAPRPDVEWAWRRLEQTDGAVPVGTLAGELGCSRRHLTVRFREEVGLPPKALARVLRFQRAIAILRDDGAHGSDGGERAPWAQVAHACGYYDQPHLNREFRAFAGLSPGEFAARLLPGGGGISGD